MTRIRTKEEIKEWLSQKEYFVYTSDFNSKEIKLYNIYSHAGFVSDIADLFYDRKDIAPHWDKCTEEVKKILAHHFWLKYEWEVVITNWPPQISNEELERLNKEKEDHIKQWGTEPYNLSYIPTVAKKIDVYEQVMLHFNDFFLDLRLDFYA